MWALFMYVSSLILFFKSFSEFMSSRAVRIVGSPEEESKLGDRNSSPQPSAVSLSMLGQAASSSQSDHARDGGAKPASVKETETCDSKGFSNDLDEVGRLIGGPTADSIQDFIMGEQLDEGSMFMDGPQLIPA